MTPFSEEVGWEVAEGASAWLACPGHLPFQFPPIGTNSPNTQFLILQIKTIEGCRATGWKEPGPQVTPTCPPSYPLQKSYETPKHPAPGGWINKPPQPNSGTLPGSEKQQTIDAHTDGPQRTAARLHAVPVTPRPAGTQSGQPFPGPGWGPGEPDNKGAWGGGEASGGDGAVLNLECGRSYTALRICQNLALYTNKGTFHYV